MAALAATGCDNKEEASSGADKADAAQAGLERKLEDAADKAGAKFAKGMGKKSCEILTPALVAQTFAVPEAELKQFKVMGCIYSRKKGDGDAKTTLEASLTMMRAHKTVEGAQLWFKNATANRTGEEIKEQMKQVTAKAKEHEDVDTDLKKTTVGTLGSMISAGMKEGTSYEPVSGVGDEAKVALSDGAIWVRVGNLTFTAKAYKGPDQPKAKIDPKDFSNLKKLTAQSMEAQRKWLQETFEERKKFGLQLAKLIIKALD